MLTKPDILYFCLNFVISVTTLLNSGSDCLKGCHGLRNVFSDIVVVSQHNFCEIPTEALLFLNQLYSMDEILGKFGGDEKHGGEVMI